MTSKKTAKRALLTSVLALVMCVAMLVGTTFAWFTDSVVSGNNVIMAGNLDIELEYWDGDSWETVNGATNLFSDELWEPGHTQVVYLRLSNLGTLALKYQFGIRVAAETAGTNINGETFNLSDVIEYGLIEGVNGETDAYADRDAARAAVTAGTKLSAGYFTAGSMNAGDAAKYMALVVYMPESVGNEANYLTGTTPPTIDLGIELQATQVEAEEDTFGPDYDGNATYDLVTYYVNKPEEFAAVLAELSASTEVKAAQINLNTDVEWVTGADYGSTPLIGSGSSVESVVINGNGNTLTATGSGISALRAANGGTLVFENLTVDDESVAYDEGNWEHTYLEFGGKLVFDHVTFLSGIQLGTDNGQAPEGAAVFTDCTFISEEASVYSVWFGNGSAEFTNCTFTGTRGLKVHECYGSNVGSVVVNGCTFQEISKKPGVVIGDIYQEGDEASYGNSTWVDASDTTVTVKNSKFIGCQDYDKECPSGIDGIYESDTVAGEWLILENNTAKKYVTVDNAEALNAALADPEVLKVTLTENYAWNADETVVIGSGVTKIIDLNGNTLAASGKQQLFRVSGGDLTLTNGDIALTGIYGNITYDSKTRTYTGGGSLCVENNGTLTISDGVNITASGTYSTGMNYSTYGYAILNLKGTVNIEGGTFDLSNRVIGVDLKGNGNFNTVYNSPVVNITGGTFKATDTAIVGSEYGTANVTGGTFEIIATEGHASYGLFVWDWADDMTRYTLDESLPYTLTGDRAAIYTKDIGDPW